MASAVDICNLALSGFGDEANVQSISPPDGTIQAEHCARHYPIARDQLQEAHAWNFNTRRQFLALLDDLDENLMGGWAYGYVLPAGTLRVLSVLPPGATDDTQTEDFVVESRDNGDMVLFTNCPEAVGRFLVQVTNTARFSPGFVVACASLLRAYVVGPIVKGKAGANLAASYMKQFVEIDFPRAAALDSSARQLRAPYKDYRPAWISDR